MKKTLVNLALAALAACAPKTKYFPENPIPRVRQSIEARTDAVRRGMSGIKEKECTVIPGLPSLVYVGGEKEKMSRLEVESYDIKCDPGVLTISYGKKGDFTLLDIQDTLNTQFPSSLHLVIYENQPLHVRFKTTGPPNEVECVGTPLEEKFVRCVDRAVGREQLPADRMEVKPYADRLMDVVTTFVSLYGNKWNKNLKGKSKGN